IFRDKNYPEILVLEIGADRLGDIKYLTKFLSLKIGVETSVAPVHIEFFGSLENIAKEKSDLVKSLKKEGIAVLNYDDQNVIAMKEKLNCQVLTFGLLPGAEFYASAISLATNQELPFVSFDLNYAGNIYRVNLPSIIAEHLIYSVLPAIAIGVAYRIELPAIIKTLEGFVAPKGRMRVIPGIKYTTIVDDTYNSSPLSAKKALYQLSRFEPKNDGRKFAVLGDMLELGGISEQAHQEIGRAVKEYGVDYLVTVGELSRGIVRGAIDAGFDADHCFNFSDLKEAGEFVQEKIKTDDIILIKGSQGMRMEKIVKEIMAEPQKAEELLVRQDKNWQ
ncbi:MAG: UDP-N-acetylmuramoyl-tripeptide--D-alanyl-D-alanine ligase, partial [Candidatus Buchananbacteria bacterium]|nr:UDP-N-acetylmuramoyl-tripeptide--D-alanyl-D-alanine ligase [Candidatus Buchananbacteria bacterium]